MISVYCETEHLEILSSGDTVHVTQVILTQLYVVNTAHGYLEKLALHTTYWLQHASNRYMLPLEKPQHNSFKRIAFVSPMI